MIGKTIKTTTRLGYSATAGIDTIEIVIRMYLIEFFDSPLFFGRTSALHMQVRYPKPVSQKTREIVEDKANLYLSDYNPQNFKHNEAIAEAVRIEKELTEFVKNL